MHWGVVVPDSSVLRLSLNEESKHGVSKNLLRGELIYMFILNAEIAHIKSVLSGPLLALDLNNHICDAQALVCHTIVITLLEDMFKGVPDSCQKRYLLFSGLSSDS